MDELDTFLQAWSTSADELFVAVADLTPEQWAAPSDCPGWSAKDVLSHLAAFENELATGAMPAPLIPLPGKPPSAWWIQAGVAQRRDWEPERILAELKESVAQRRAAYAANPPTDPTGKPPQQIGNLTWDNRTLLRNRAIDMWVH